jgi:hypothetical protein
MFSAPFLVTLLDRVKAVVRRVARPVAERVRPAVMEPRIATLPGGPAIDVLRGRAGAWMAKRLKALSALLRRIEAGERFPSPAHAPRAASARCVAALRTAPAPAERLPHGFGWMCSLGPNVRRDGQAFADWLDEPVMTAMVMAAPDNMARVVGPILRATGQRRPEWFPVVARARRRRPRDPLASRAANLKSDANEAGSRAITPAACRSALERRPLRGRTKVVRRQRDAAPPNSSSTVAEANVRVFAKMGEFAIGKRASILLRYRNILRSLRNAAVAAIYPPSSNERRTRSAVRATPSLVLICEQLLATVL